MTGGHMQVAGPTSAASAVCLPIYGYDEALAGALDYDGPTNLRIHVQRRIAGIPPQVSSQNAPVTGLDYFGARYFSGAQGRFTSPDPLGVNLLRVLNPQRWNMYAYAVNNPLAYTDPDGRDALAVKFGTGAQGLGHSGLASVHHDGSTRFADFGPQHSGSFHDKGNYTFLDLNARVVYGGNGRPTKESLVGIANELADREGVPRDSVSVAYFKSSDAETALLDAYIDQAAERQKKGTQPSYWGGFRDCIWFTYNGLKEAGHGRGSSPLTIPNWAWWDFWFMSGTTATGTKPDPEADRKPPHKRCLQDRDGNCVQ